MALQQLFWRQSWLVGFRYLQKLSLVFVKERSNLFLSYRGEAMSSGQISKAMQSVWAKAGLSSSIACTLIRKTAVSAIHQHVPESWSNLADLISHRLETATKSYRLADKNRSTVAASRTLTDIMERQSTVEFYNHPKNAGDWMTVAWLKQIRITLMMKMKMNRCSTFHKIMALMTIARNEHSTAKMIVQILYHRQAMLSLNSVYSVMMKLPFWTGFASVSLSLALFLQRELPMHSTSRFPEKISWKNSKCRK